ncbi:MAG: hypothetical protein J7527_07315 [Chitinophagaceae bacterium]|nr:hypothetical protein [Chitinophagaceae bacterium]
MAISHALVPFTGRVGNVVYYYVGNEIYCRTIYPNIRNTVMKDERYALFRVYSGLFGQSSKIASEIYRTLEINDVKLYRSIVKDATQLFKHTGMRPADVREILWKKWVEGIDIDSPEVCRHGITKKVIEKNPGKTVREHIAKLQKRKAGQMQRERGIVVQQIPASKSEQVLTEKAMEIKDSHKQASEKRLRIMKAVVRVRSRILEVEEGLLV